jgi:hypothetical protein
VHAVETAFNWRSVSLTGTLSALPDGEYSKLDDVPVGGWRPELLRNAGTSGEVTVYEFEIEARTGVRHTGLPPELQDETR